MSRCRLKSSEFYTTNLSQSYDGIAAHLQRWAVFSPFRKAVRSERRGRLGRPDRRLFPEKGILRS